MRILLDLRHGLIEAHIALGTVRRFGIPPSLPRRCHFKASDPQGFAAPRTWNLEQAPKRRNGDDDNYYGTRKPENETSGTDADQGSRYQEKSDGPVGVLRVALPKKIANGHCIAPPPRFRSIVSDPFLAHAKSPISVLSAARFAPTAEGMQLQITSWPNRGSVDNRRPGIDRGRRRTGAPDARPPRSSSGRSRSGSRSDQTFISIRPVIGALRWIGAHGSSPVSRSVRISSTA
jgi:hypothetical protein